MFPDGRWVYMMRERQSEAQRQLMQRCLIREARLSHEKRRGPLVRRMIRYFKSLQLVLSHQDRQHTRKPSLIRGHSIVDNTKS